MQGGSSRRGQEAARRAVSHERHASRPDRPLGRDESKPIIFSTGLRSKKPRRKAIYPARNTHRAGSVLRPYRTSSIRREIRCHLERRCRFASRTPAPPPFSGIISTPAFSRACAIASIVRPCAANSPRRVSSRLMLGRDTPDASAKSFCSHRSSIRAARTCSLVSDKFNTSGIDLHRASV